MIAALPNRYQNVTVLDWSALATTCPGDCFYPDEIHLRTDGRQFYADMITTEVNRLADATDPDGTATVDTPTTVLTKAELAQWLGTWTMEPQSVTAHLGSTGTIDYTLDATPSSFCINSNAGGACALTPDGSQLVDAPMSLGTSGIVTGSSGSWSGTFIAPLDASVRFLDDHTPACEMHRFTLEPYGNAALWACEQTTPIPTKLHVEITRGPEVRTAEMTT